MKFSLRRRAAAAVAPTAPVSALSPDQIFALVHEKMAEFVGSEGTWVVSRRSTTEGDPIFHDMLARSIAHEVATAIHLETVRAGGAIDPIATITTAPIAVVKQVPVPGAPVAAAPDSAEPVSLRWSPEPITVWADGATPRESRSVDA